MLSRSEVDEISCWATQGCFAQTAQLVHRGSLGDGTDPESNFGHQQSTKRTSSQHHHRQRYVDSIRRSSEILGNARPAGAGAAMVAARSPMFRVNGRDATRADPNRKPCEMVHFGLIIRHLSPEADYPLKGFSTCSGGVLCI